MRFPFLLSLLSFASVEEWTFSRLISIFVLVVVVVVVVAEEEEEKRIAG